MELESLDTGDKIEIVYEVADSTTGKVPGEEVTLEMTVEYNTIGDPESHMFHREKMCANTSTFGLKAVVTPDGAVEVRPKFNSNGKVDYGEVIEVN